MYPFLLIMSGATLHVLNLGLARHRGALTLALAFAGLVAAVVQDRVTGDLGGYCGVVLAVGLVAAVRQVWAWLCAGGFAVVGQWTARVVNVVAWWLYDLAAGFLQGLLSPARGEPLQATVQHPEPVSPPADPRTIQLKHGDRWGMLTPREPALEPAGGATVTPLRAVETYSDWLPTSVETAGGYRAAAREATARWGRSESSWKRDYAKLRGEDQAA